MNERAEGNYSLGLQTPGIVVPSRDANIEDLFKTRKDYLEKEGRPNRLIYGDNLLAMATLLAGENEGMSFRGAVDLIYIDPPYDSKADYRSSIEILGAALDQSPTVLEQFAYTDTWAEGTTSYLKIIVPRLYLMKEQIARQHV